MNNEEEILTNLKGFREEFRSLEAMAQALRVIPGFEDINRATISRWLKKPVRRTAIAVKYLLGRKTGPNKVLLQDQLQRLSQLEIAVRKLQITTSEIVRQIQTEVVVLTNLLGK